MWQIARKEISHNLLSLRFAMGVALSLLMVGVVGYVQVGDFAARQQAHISDVQRHARELDETKVYSRLSVSVDFPPSALSMFGHGIRDLPSGVTVSPYQVPTLLDVGGSASIDLWGTSRLPYNPLLRIFSYIDLAFVVRTILSLFALLLTFDAYAGEREGHTLALVMACPVRRLEVVAGKFAGALMTAAAPLAITFAAIGVLWSLSGQVAVDGALLRGVAVIFGLSLAYLAAFVALGLWVSLWARDSATSLMVLLLIWVGVVVVIPEGVGFLANWTRPRQARQEMVDAVEREVGQLEAAYWRLGEDFPSKGAYWGYSTSGMTGGDQLLSTTREEVANLAARNQVGYPLKFEAADLRYRLSEPYERALTAWARGRRHLMRLSLASVYSNLVEAVAGTGLEGYEAALDQARAYRHDLVDYLRPKVGQPVWFTRVLEYPDMLLTPENQERWRARQAREGYDVLWSDILTWEKIAPLDLSALPRPAIRHLDLAQRLAAAWTDLTLLVLFALAAVIAVGRQALRAPIL